MNQPAYNPQRKIATIMAADIVSYSRMMRENEESTLKELQLRRAAFEFFVDKFGGRIFGTVGDSFMAEFPSVLNSVRCAINLQAAIKELNKDLPENNRMRLRIGLNLGDVVRQGKDLFGDGVNVAARLEPIADPGGVCIAGNVFEQVHRKLKLNYQFIGYQHVKNIDTPVTAFKILSSEDVQQPLWKEYIHTLKYHQIFRYQQSLILLVSFIFLGLVQSLIKHNMLRLITFVVIALSAIIYSFVQMKKRQTPVFTQGEQELVDSKVIEAALVSIKNKILNTPVNGENADKSASGLTSLAVLRFTDLSAEQDQAYFSDGLTEELINVLAKTKKLNVSSRTSSFAFDRDAMQGLEFAKNLGVEYFLEGSVRKSHNRLRITAQLIEVSTNTHLWSETYDRVLKDIFEIQDDISGKIAEALRVKLDPMQDKESLTSDSRAYDFYLRGRAFFGYKGIENIRYAIQMYTMAAKTDPGFIRAWTDLAETYAIQAIFYDGGDNSTHKAKEIANKVLLLAPERGETYVALGMAHLAKEEYALAAGRFEKAIEIDPTLFEAYHNFARTHYHQGNLKEAIRYFEKAAVVDESDFESYALAAPLYTALENPEGAMLAYKKALERIEEHIKDYPENQRAYQLGAISLLQIGEKEKANQWAEQAVKLSPDDPATRYNTACFYAQAGDQDKAFYYLKNSISSRSWIENDPELKPLRSDPRFAEIINGLEG